MCGPSSLYCVTHLPYIFYFKIISNEWNEYWLTNQLSTCIALIPQYNHLLQFLTQQAKSTRRRCKSVRTPWFSFYPSHIISHSPLKFCMYIRDVSRQHLQLIDSVQASVTKCLMLIGSEQAVVCPALYYIIRTHYTWVTLVGSPV